MPRPPIRQNTTGNPAEDRRAQETASDVKALLGAPFLKGRSVTFEATGAGNVTVAHGLGRKPSGWFPTDVTGGAATIFRVSWTDRHVVFTVSGPAAFALWMW